MMKTKMTVGEFVRKSMLFKSDFAEVTIRSFKNVNTLTIGINNKFNEKLTNEMKDTKIKFIDKLASSGDEMVFDLYIWHKKAPEKSGAPSYLFGVK